MKKLTAISQKSILELKIQDVKKLAQEGLTAPEIGRQLQVSQRTIHRWAEKYQFKVTLNVRGAKSKNHLKLVQAVQELAKTGKTAAQISKELNIPRQTIRTWSKKYDIPLILGKSGRQLSENKLAKTERKTHPKEYVLAHLDELKAQAKLLNAQGMTNSQISKTISVHTSTLFTWLRGSTKNSVPDFVPQELVQDFREIQKTFGRHIAEREIKKMLEV